MRSTTAGIWLASLTVLALVTGCTAAAHSPEPSPTTSSPSESPMPSEPAFGSLDLEPDRLVLVGGDGVEQEFLFAEPTDGDAAVAALTGILGPADVEDLGEQYTLETLVRSGWDGVDILVFHSSDGVRWVVEADAAAVDDLTISTIGGITVGDTRAGVLRDAPDAIEWGVPQLLIGGGGDQSGQVAQVGLGMEGDAVASIIAPSCSCDV